MEKEENLYRKMNAIFEEREAIFEERENKLQKGLSELHELEQKIDEGRKLLLEEQNKLAAVQEQMDRRADELDEREQCIEEEQKELFELRLEVQSYQNARLLEVKAQESEELQQTVDALSEQPDSTQQPMIQTVQEADIPAAADDNPQTLTERFVVSARTVFPDGKGLELTEDMFCLEIGNKELRIMAQNPPAAVILTRREKSKELMKGIEQCNRMQDEWTFSYEDSCLRCMMPFTAATSEELVLKKCAEAMNKYFLE